MNTLESIFESIRTACDRPLSQAPPLPREAYRSTVFHDWERTTLLEGGWMPVAHVPQIPNAGDFITLDLLDEPLVVVRGKDDVVRILSRVCPHRAMDILPPRHAEGKLTTAEQREGLPESCGRTRFFLCPYHSWTFDLDGKLRACPEMQQAECFHKQETGLHEFRCEVWNGFIFLNRSGAAPPLADGLVEMDSAIAPWKPADLDLVYQAEWDCDFDWKVLVENFMESYHHLGAHRKTLQLLMPAKNTWTAEERRHFIHGHLPCTSRFRDQIAASLAAGDATTGFPVIKGLSEDGRTHWHLYLVHPCFLFFTGHDCCAWYRVHPEGPGKMRILTCLLVPKETRQREDFPQILESKIARLLAFHREDMEACTAVQRGFASRARTSQSS
jgi:phenylpropionate dioxygenase-like ring-hydroxylating dioxygenase large terminal subunit